MPLHNFHTSAFGQKISRKIYIIFTQVQNSSAIACNKGLFRPLHLPRHSLCLNIAVSVTPASTDPANKFRHGCYWLLLDTTDILLHFHFIVLRQTDPYSTKEGSKSKKWRAQWGEEAVIKIICYCQWDSPGAYCNQYNHGVCNLYPLMINWH
jgi:hypothetical protein